MAQVGAALLAGPRLASLYLRPISAPTPPPSQPRNSAQAEVLKALTPMERVTWLQFDLPMMKRGALLHWSLADNLMERQTLLLLGVSVEEQPDIERPASAAGVTLAEFKAIKVVVRPRTTTSAQIRWVMNVDLKANVPQPIISMVATRRSNPLSSPSPSPEPQPATRTRTRTPTRSPRRSRERSFLCCCARRRR